MTSKRPKNYPTRNECQLVERCLVRKLSSPESDIEADVEMVAGKVLKNSHARYPGLARQVRGMPEAGVAGKVCGPPFNMFRHFWRNILNGGKHTKKRTPPGRRDLPAGGRGRYAS